MADDPQNPRPSEEEPETEIAKNAFIDEDELLEAFRLAEEARTVIRGKPKATAPTPQPPKPAPEAKAPEPPAAEAPSDETAEEATEDATEDAEVTPSEEIENYEFPEEQAAGAEDDALMALLGEFIGDDAPAEESEAQEVPTEAAAPAPPQPPEAPAPKEEMRTDLLDEDELAALAAQLEGSAGPAAPQEGTEATPDEALAAEEQTEPEGVFGGADDTTPVGQEDMDAPILGEASAAASAPDPMESVAEPEPQAPPAPSEPEPAAETGKAEAPLPQELMDALLGAAGEEQAQPDVGAENLAAAASTEPVREQSIHDDLDPLFEHGDQEREETTEDQPALSPEPVVQAARETPARRPRKPSFDWSAFLRQNAPRMTASLAAGLLVGITTFLILNTIRMRNVDPAELARGHVSELALALAQAKDLMDQDAYLRAAVVLDGPLSRAAAGEVRDAAEFVYLEARFRGLQPAFGTPNFEELVRDIDDLVSRTPNHPRAPEALYWKAKLYEASDLTRAANDVYANIISNYSDMQGFDVILVEAGGLNLKIREPRQTAAYMQRLLLNYPDSPLAGEARLLLGDAYAQAGMYDDARTLYVRTAQAGTDAASRNDAIQRLGKLAFSQGNYDAAVRELGNYLRTATTTEGSDEVYLMLAQAYREQGDLEMARNTLMDLLNFLPESDVTPRAYVAITDVYEALGERKPAMRMARQGAVMFPDNPDTLENKGRMLGLSGNPVGAAEALLAADESGANDPALLLTAARHYVTAGHTGRALDTYERIRALYPRLDEAFTADVEAAQLRYRLAEVGEAVQTLEDLINATSQTDQRVQALEALTDIYTDLELSDRLRQTALSLAAEARDPETLGKAARALFASGALEEGREVMDRIALGQLPDREAFALLSQFGTSLLEVDPNRGLDMLEQAHTAYPAQRTVSDDIQLMAAYISADRPAAARRMVMQIDTHVRENPIDTPYLVEAAIAWGDFLFDNEDYRMAADAYQMAMEAAEPTPQGILLDRDVDPRWAQYQRANALFELEDFDASLDLLNAIASSDAPWAEEAAVKAEYARIEQRLRGAPGVRTGTQG